MRGERDYSLKEAEATIEVYGDQLDRIAEMLTSVHPLGAVKAIGRLECSAALAEVLDDAPSWQDGPTGPGLWVYQTYTGRMECTRVQDADMVDYDRSPWKRGRVYGPIPADETTTEPSP